MTRCPKCGKQAVTSERDMYRDGVTCIMCGWAGETRPASEADNFPVVIGPPRKHRPTYAVDLTRSWKGAPRPRRADFVGEKDYMRAYHNWYYHNARGAGYEPSVRGNTKS